AVHNDQMDAEELYVSACYADEGSTLKRWRPRARGRATRIRKRTSHVTVIVSRMPDDRIARRRAQRAAATSHRSRRVAGSRRRQARTEAAEATTADVTPEVESRALDQVDHEGADEEVTGDDENVDAADAEVIDVEAVEESEDGEEPTSDAEGSDGAAHPAEGQEES
ncbi:MAG: hypothetical protein JO368_02510, partial [Acidimicrobiales bacterium]|nr:hypothetical protein [Acidimicrobiales bacterium]